jgi:hypothetical protein
MLLTKCVDDDIDLVKGLKNEVQALKSRCNMLEKNVKALLSICPYVICIGRVLTHFGLILSIVVSSREC